MKKVIISTTGILLSLLIIFSSAVHFNSAEKDESVCVDKIPEKITADLETRSIGDIDGSGTVDVKDAFLLQCHAAKLTFCKLPLIDECNKDLMNVADINRDSMITIGDATLVQQIAADAFAADPNIHKWTQTPKTVLDYLENAEYDPSDYSYSVIQNYAPSIPDISNEQPIGITLKTDGGTLVRKGYSIDITPGDFTLYNDIPNKLTPYNMSQNGSVYQSGALRPTHFLRQIKCVNTRNVRDLGGWNCDGGTVKYGILIRGGVPSADDIDILANQCGIRTQLDLRGSKDIVDPFMPRVSVLGDNVACYKIPRYAWYTIDDTELWRTILQITFDSVKNNKPVYFHCEAGADRTGTFACVLEAILGLDQRDIDKDYELTSFYTGTDPKEARQRNNFQWVNLVSQIRAKAPSGSDSPMRDGAVQFALELGFTIDEINEFRATMIDGTPEKLTAK